MSEPIAPIIYEAGARIADVPENKGLLDQLAQATPLSPEVLFNTIAFFNAFSATQPLALRIAAFAYSRYVVDQGRTKGGGSFEANADEDWDWLDGWDEADQDEANEIPWRARVLEMKWILPGLLVEVVKDDITKLAYYVVGNIGDPTKLPVD